MFNLYYEAGRVSSEIKLDSTAQLSYNTVMREHMSITIDSDLARKLKKASIEERRSVSRLVEIAVERYLDKFPPAEQIVTTHAAFNGRFTREDTYAGR